MSFTHTLATKHCNGCEVSHPSQRQHTCLMWTEFENLDMYLEEALETVDRICAIQGILKCLLHILFISRFLTSFKCFQTSMGLVSVHFSL
jgi:hypothetical protein